MHLSCPSASVLLFFVCSPAFCLPMFSCPSPLWSTSVLPVPRSTVLPVSCCPLALLSNGFLVIPCPAVLTVSCCPRVLLSNNFFCAPCPSVYCDFSNVLFSSCLVWFLVLLLLSNSFLSVLFVLLPSSFLPPPSPRQLHVG
jgi:hypothetical protein